MIDGYIIKHPSEIVNYTFDFTNEVPSGDSIASVTITMYNSEETEMSATGVTSSAISSPSVAVLLAAIGASSDGMDYRLLCKATLTSGAARPYKIAEVRVRSKQVNA